jgi:outer membrane protein OmpA-like peptidoglycan-associated protein
MYKKLFIGLCLLACCSIPKQLLAQHMQGIGIHFGAYDFWGPQTGDYITSDRRTSEYNELRQTYDTAHHKKFYWRPMVKFSYWWQVTRNFDVSTSLSMASLEYPMSSDDTAFVNKYRLNLGNRRERFLGELDLRFNYNILPRDQWIVSPYLFAGVNASYHDIFFGADVPLGAGLNIALNKERSLSLNLESAYKIAATNHDVNHLQHSFGLIYWFKPGYHVPKAETVAATETAPTAQPKDRDNDGVEDDQDQCPDIPGLAQFNGCPDTDGDGISDKDDACPLVAGLAQFNGCPDSDNDGIPDNKDKCPYAAGTSQYDGCPPPDRDHDGVTDDVDRCPDVPGTAANQGCPEIRQDLVTQVEKAAKAIFFETGKATIKKVSYKSLDAVVSVLKADPSLNADIEGHTDNVAPKTYTNMELSQKRADAVRDYLVSKGISADRLTAQGFGDTQPVASNATAAGKAQNRRTVIKLRNYRK